MKTAGSMIVVIWLLVTVCMQLKPRTLVEPIAVPKSLAEHGVTEQVMQQQLAYFLNDVVVDASAEMPSQIRAGFETDEPEANIELLGTGLSLDAVVHYTKRMFGINDVYIRGSLRPTETGLCELELTISHGSSEQSLTVASQDKTERCADANEGTLRLPQIQNADWRATNPTPLISLAADQVMENNNLFIYAEAQSHRAREKCYLSKRPCDYNDAKKSFNAVLNDASKARYYKWSWLALSKIDEDQGDYVGEVHKAMLSVKEDETFSWGYYNWGIGLAERGCGEEALSAFLQAVRYGRQSHDFAFAYNAVGRQALNLIRTDHALASKDVDRLRGTATGYLMMATELEPDYAEAYVNLGDAISELPDPTLRQEAPDQYLAAIQLESQQTRRAIASMKQHGEVPLPSLAKLLDDHSILPPICTSGEFARSVLDSNGCVPSDLTLAHDKEAMPTKVAAHLAAVNGPRPDCESDSVAKNVGVLQPFLVNPVYSIEEPLTGTVPMMLFH